MANNIYHGVVRTRDQVTPNMLRFSLESEALSDFPDGFEGGYVKLVFPRPEAKRPAMRSYTVRSFDRDARQVTLEMVTHGDLGPAGRWAERAKLGDSIVFAGPGPCRSADPSADWFLLAGDMTALPAISVQLENLPPNAVGDAVIEVISDEDRRKIIRPDGIEVHWITNPEPARPNSLLADAVMNLPWRSGRVSAWIASEFANARALRQYMRHDRAVDRDSLYVSCYWKIGDTDEGMKAAKGSDSESW